MNKLIALIQAEPVAAQAVVQSGVAAACAFGLNLSPPQIAAVLALSAAALAFFTRRAVTANVSLK